MKDIGVTSTKVPLSGRYLATLSLLPFVVFGVFLFFVVALIFVYFIVGDMIYSFEIIWLPFALGLVIMAPLYLAFLFLVRWHAHRYLELVDEGVLVVNPKGTPIFIQWDHLLAVELRFVRPQIVQCTLVTPNVVFSFSNLELNLTRRGSLIYVFRQGFRLNPIREFLMLLHTKAPDIEWRLSQRFKDRFKVQYPPYDLNLMC